MAKRHQAGPTGIARKEGSQSWVVLDSRSSYGRRGPAATALSPEVKPLSHRRPASLSLQGKMGLGCKP